MNNFDVKKSLALLVILILTIIGVTAAFKTARDKF